jgi:hypothetical protein
MNAASPTGAAPRLADFLEIFAETKTLDAYPQGRAVTTKQVLK